MAQNSQGFNQIGSAIRHLGRLRKTHQVRRSACRSLYLQALLNCVSFQIPMNESNAPVETNSKFLRVTLILCGWISMTLAIFALMVPLIPSIPFLIVASICFGKSSPRFHHWLHNHKHFGPILDDWQNHGVISPKAKWFATVCIGVSMVTTGFVFQVRIWVWALVNFCLGSMLLYIWTRPGKVTKIDRPQ